MPSDQAFAKMQRSLDPLHPLVADFPVVRVHVTIEQHARDGADDVWASLELPQETLSVRQTGPAIETAFADCVRGLVRQVTAYKSELRGDEEHAKHAAGTHHEVVATDTPREEAIEAAMRERDVRTFRDAMAPFEPSLRARIGRWVQQDPALEAAIGRGLAIDDIVEEVFLLAFEGWEGRPSRRRLGLWLEDLIPEAVEVILRNPDEARRNLDAVRAFRELPRE